MDLEEYSVVKIRSTARVGRSGIYFQKAIYPTRSSPINDEDGNITPYGELCKIVDGLAIMHPFDIVEGFEESSDGFYKLYCEDDDFYIVNV